MATPDSRAEHAGEHFKVEFICTCGEEHTEYFLTNDKSKTKLVYFVSQLIGEGVVEMVIFKVAPDSVEDVTISIMLAILVLYASTM